ncbi:hypothetical protein BH23BAC1_BH23BAC1_26000 [soil metagenome]
MKTLIVPTDYSVNARNAINFAAQLAKDIHAKLELLHVFHLPVVIDEAPHRMISMEEMEKVNLKQSSALAKEVQDEFDIKVDSSVYPGFVSDVLSEVMENRPGDVVVMGMRGINPSRRLLWGGVTASVLHDCTFPLLIIPSDAKYRPVKNILITCDFQPVSAQNKFQLIKDLAFIYSAKVQVVHFKKPEAALVEVAGCVESGQQLERALRGVRHSYSTIEKEDIIKGIEECVKANKANLLVMVHRKKSFWKNITTGSFTKKMAFHSHIPLLALPYVQK